MQVSGHCHALVAFRPQERTPVIHKTGGWVDPKSQIWFGHLKMGENLLLLLDIEPRFFSRPLSSLVTEQSECNSSCTRPQFLSFISLNNSMRI